MRIRPGVGIPDVSIGDHRKDVETAVGVPPRTQGQVAYYHDTRPSFSVHYTGEQRVELIEVFYSGAGHEEVFLEDTQLTYRLMDDVVAELAQAGLRCRQSDIGMDYEAGFAIWSMTSIHPRDLNAETPIDDERLVVEGVSVAPYAYFAD